MKDVAKELAALHRMSVAQLREKYADVFGEATATGNRTWLIRRIAWRIPANAEGDLSERAKARAAELARDADLRITAPREKPAPVPTAASSIVAREGAPEPSDTRPRRRAASSPASTRAWWCGSRCWPTGSSTPARDTRP